MKGQNKRRHLEDCALTGTSCSFQQQSLQWLNPILMWHNKGQRIRARIRLGDTNRSEINSFNQRLLQAAAFLGVVVDRLLLDSDRMNLLKARVQLLSQILQPCISGLAWLFISVPENCGVSHHSSPFETLDLLVLFHSPLGVQESFVLGSWTTALSHLHSACFNSTGVQQILVEFLIVSDTVLGRGYYFGGEINNDPNK